MGFCGSKERRQSRRVLEECQLLPWCFRGNSSELSKIFPQDLGQRRLPLRTGCPAAQPPTADKPRWG